MLYVQLLVIKTKCHKTLCVYIKVWFVNRRHRADVFSDELLKTLAEDGYQSNGPPVIQACDFIFLWYGHNGGFFEA